MQYEIETTEYFDAWLDKLDGSIKRRLAVRFAQVECGNFGDFKPLAANLFELRCFFGGGIRVYYTQRNDCVVILLAGGDKDTQARDIARAGELLAQIKE